MKVDWSTVWEIVIGIMLAGTILMILNNLFGAWLQRQGEKLLPG